MASEFVKLVNSFLDLEAQDDNWAKIALDYGFETVASEKGRYGFEDDQRHIAIAEVSSTGLIKRRVFPDAKPGQFQSPQNEQLEELAFDEPGDLRPTSNANPILERMKAYQEELRVRAEREGVTIEQMKEMVAEERETARVAALRSPNVRRAMLRRYLHKLDSVAERIECLDSLPSVWENVPEHLKVLVSNAHESSLLGQDVACAVLCGTALEEALKIRLGRDNYRSFMEALKLAVERKYFQEGSPELRAAEYVKEMRNKAAHNPEGYLISLTKNRRDILIATRIALSQLFAPLV